MPIEELKNICFFCSKPIEEKKTQEHVIPDSLLGKLGIKQETLNGKGAFLYSRIKVPAHKTCNNEFGSQYENEVIRLLDNPVQLFEDLIEEENSILLRYDANKSVTSILSTWLLKIYYGLFYNDYLKVDDVNYKETCEAIINTHNFKIIQNAYKDGVGFYLPSSLFVFQSNNDKFDLLTFAYPQAIMIKIKKLVFILLVVDGFLTKNYLNGKQLDSFRKNLLLEEIDDTKFNLQLRAFIELLALRVSIPKKPSFSYSDKEVINMSLSTSVNNPHEYYRIDNELLNTNRAEIVKLIFNH